METVANTGAIADFGVSLLSRVDAEGSLPIAITLVKFLENSQKTKDLRLALKTIRPALVADIAHFMCISHGRHPGIIDYAADKIVDDVAREWLLHAIDGFSTERGFLNQLTVAAGPIRRMAGQDKLTSLLQHQAKSFQMLATSDRNGTAAGAAIAFLIDWQLCRPVFDQMALGLAIEPPVNRLPSAAQCQEMATALAQTPSQQRAMQFGAEQLLAQQRGLWQLIAARHSEINAIK